LLPPVNRADVDAMFTDFPTKGQEAVQLNLHFQHLRPFCKNNRGFSFFVTNSYTEAVISS
jgi:hypothetical protein